MKNFKTYTMRFLHSTIAFSVDPSIRMDAVFDFFSSHFSVYDHVEDNPLANIILTRDIEPFRDIDFMSGHHMFLRKSYSDFFTIPGKRVIRDGVEFIQCTKTNTLLAFDRTNKRITIAVRSNDIHAEELVCIELIRDLVLKNEETHGVIVLHATCAYKRDAATVIVGPKGAGKSSTLLELVHKFDFLFMSGDKTLLWVQDGQLMAAGWPDYPHLGLGTLSKYPELVSTFKLSEQIANAQQNIWSTQYKMAIDPQRFKQLIPHAPQGIVCPVGNFFYPRLFPSETCSIVPLENHLHLLTPHIERSFVDGEDQWNHYVLPNERLNLEQSMDTCLDRAVHMKGFELIGSGEITDDTLEAIY